MTVRYSRSADQFIPAHHRLPPTRQDMIRPLVRASAVRLDAARQHKPGSTWRVLRQ
jgi:hypothetical protein